MRYVRLILGHMEPSWAHVGLRVGHFSFILGHLGPCQELCWATTQGYAGLILGYAGLY